MPSAGPPPLRPFGLRLHRDGRFSHEGLPIANRRLRERFERSVRYLPDERVYVVQVGRFRGQLEVEEAAFFVRSIDLGRGTLRLSDGSDEALDPASLRLSALDRHGLLCIVKRDLAPGGLPARFTHAAQAELWLAVEAGPAGQGVRLAGRWHPLPAGLGG